MIGRITNGSVTCILSIDHQDESGKRAKNNKCDSHQIQHYQEAQDSRLILSRHDHGILIVYPLDIALVVKQYMWQLMHVSVRRAGEERQVRGKNYGTAAAGLSIRQGSLIDGFFKVHWS